MTRSQAFQLQVCGIKNIKDKMLECENEAIPFSTPLVCRSNCKTNVANYNVLWCAIKSRRWNTRLQLILIASTFLMSHFDSIFFFLSKWHFDSIYPSRPYGIHKKVNIAIFYKKIVHAIRTEAFVFLMYVKAVLNIMSTLLLMEYLLVI